MNPATKAAVIEALESCDPGDWSTGHVIHPSYNEDKVNAALALLYAEPEPTTEENSVVERERFEAWLVENRFDASSVDGQYVRRSPDTRGWHGKLPPLPEPSLLKLPDDGEGYSDEAPYIWAWFAHGYDTGMTPYFSDDQMNAFAQLAADHALEEAAKACENAINSISDELVIGCDRRDAGINTCNHLAATIRAMKGKP